MRAESINNYLRIKVTGVGVVPIYKLCQKSKKLAHTNNENKVQGWQISKWKYHQEKNTYIFKSVGLGFYTYGRMTSQALKSERRIPVF